MANRKSFNSTPLGVGEGPGEKGNGEGVRPADGGSAEGRGGSRGARSRGRTTARRPPRSRTNMDAPTRRDTFEIIEQGQSHVDELQMENDRIKEQIALTEEEREVLTAERDKLKERITYLEDRDRAWEEEKRDLKEKAKSGLQCLRNAQVLKELAGIDLTAMTLKESDATSSRIPHQ